MTTDVLDCNSLAGTRTKLLPCKKKRKTRSTVKHENAHLKWLEFYFKLYADFECISCNGVNMPEVLRPADNPYVANIILPSTPRSCKWLSSHHMLHAPSYHVQTFSSAFESGSRVIMQKTECTYRNFLHRCFKGKRLESSVQRRCFNRTLMHVVVRSKASTTGFHL